MRKLKITASIFLCSIFFKIHSADNVSCSSTKSINYPIQWPNIENGARTISDPPCLNENKEFIYRECSNGVWTNESKCVYTQLLTIPQCPAKFYETDNMCIKMVRNVTFPFNCPYEEMLPFHYYESIDFQESIWVPVQRDLSNGLGFLQWFEASLLYRTSFNEQFHMPDSIQDKNCIILAKNKSLQAVSCANRYTGVCAYKKLNQLDESLCSSLTDMFCKQSDFSPKSKCFCVGGSSDNSSLYNKADFIYAHQNYVYSFLTADDCTFGLKKTSNGSYIWDSANTEINYTNWAKSVVFDDVHIYGAQTKNGWVLTPTPNPCFLYQIDIQAPESQLDLYFDESLQKFKINVTNVNGIKRGESNTPLIFCFTDASSWSLLYRYPLIDPNFQNLEIAPTFHGPGHYWCEGFTYPDNTILKTSVFFYKPPNFGPEFVTILNISYIIGIDPLGDYITEFLERILTLSLSSVEEFKNYIIRIMKIESLDEDAYQITVNIHFTRRNQSNDEDQEYNLLRQLVYQQLTSIEAVKAQVIDFRSTDYCQEITLSDETWSKTNVNTSTFSQKYCFFPNGTRAAMWCVGDFISGASWQLNVDCIHQNHTEITDDLENLLGEVESGDFNINDLNSLLQISLNPLDVYLIFQILSNIKGIDSDNLYNLVVILLNIDDYVLWQSQSVMKATDAILNFLSSVHVTTKNYSDFCMFSGDTFTKTKAVLLVKDGSNNVLIQETDDFQEATLDNIPNLEFALLWSGVDQGTFVYFDKDAFFQENEFNEQVNSNIFGVIFSQTRNMDRLVKIMFQITNTEWACMSWEIDDMGNGYWDERWDNQTIISTGYGVCEFKLSGFYGVKQTGLPYSTTSSSNPTIDSTTTTVSSNGSTNVTQDLFEVLGSNSTDLIYELLYITERYREFNSLDVFLVGKILDRLVDDSELDLQALTYVISNMHKIDHAVLSESQQTHAATDEILNSLDEILKSHKYQPQVNYTSENFFVMIVDLVVTNITGMVLLNENDSVTLHLLQQSFNVKDLIDYYPNLESGLIISRDLLDQLESNQTIIITIFANDSLFNEEKKTAKYVSRIFGVIFPEIGNFSGPIFLVHNVMSEYQEQCVHWFYNKTNNIPGSWKQDCAGKNASTLIHCEFWHTTHFALLLLDHDIYENDLDILDWITTVNCILSLFGASCIILTAICFKRWRSNTGNQVLLNFVVAIILEIGIFYGSNTAKNLSDNELLCTIIGAVLHYCIVSQFCWMFIIAILQFKRFVEVFTKPPKYVLLKACLCGWVLPLLPVTCVVILDDNNYTKGNTGLCYPSGLGLYLGVWLPVALIVAINFVIFLFIIYNIVHRKTECVIDAGNSDVIFQWKLAILLFFMLGLTWIFGFLSELNWGIVFVYLFCITATLQGFIMFLFFIVFNTGTRYLYVQTFRKCFHNKEF